MGIWMMVVTIQDTRNFFFDHHNDDFFGLARADTGLSNTKSKDWTYLSLYNKRENARIINNLNNDIS